MGTAEPHPRGEREGRGIATPRALAVEASRSDAAPRSRWAAVDHALVGGGGSNARVSGIAGLWQAPEGVAKLSAPDPTLRGFAAPRRAGAAACRVQTNAGRYYGPGPQSSQFRPILAVCIYTGRNDLWGCPWRHDSSFSRFPVKLVEIVAASIATAAGGFPSRISAAICLGRRLAGAAAIQAAPNVSVDPKDPRARPAPPIAAGPKEHRPASHRMPFRPPSSRHGRLGSAPGSAFPQADDGARPRACRTT